MGGTISLSIFPRPLDGTFVLGLLVRDLLNLPRVVALQVLLVPVEELHIVVRLPPIVIELGALLLVDVVVVVCFLNLSTSFFPYYFSTFVVQHSLLRYPVDSQVVFVRLVLLRDGVTALVFPHVILEIVLPVHLPIGPYFR